MTVYVDDSRIPARVGAINGRWSHLFADTQEELHAFAQGIGLRRDWFQPGRPSLSGKPSDLWHYDVVESKRQQAIEAGATAVTWREAADIIRQRRARDAAAAQPQEATR